MNYQTCCCTGHRPKGFTFKYGIDEPKHKAYLEQLKQKILLSYREYGITHFVSGMAIGVDLDFAEIVLNLRDAKHYPFSLECAIPCPNQTLKWSETDKLKYNSLLARADSVNLISERYTHECMLKRNRYMVDKSSVVIAAFNGIEKGGTWYTIKYAKSKNKIIELIDLHKIN